MSDELYYLEDQVRKVSSIRLRAICTRVLGDPRFHTGFGGSKHHHAYEGGLVDHTAEVLRYALGMWTGSIDNIVTAVIMHDYHKIYEYARNGGVVISLPYRKTVGHVVGGWKQFMNWADELMLDIAVRDEIGHALLAHHGRREWGSPVEPASPLAFVLHSADMLSVQNYKERK